MTQREALLMIWEGAKVWTSPEMNEASEIVRKMLSERSTPEERDAEEQITAEQLKASTDRLETVLAWVDEQVRSPINTRLKEERDLYGSTATEEHARRVRMDRPDNSQDDAEIFSDEHDS